MSIQFNSCMRVQSYVCTCSRKKIQSSNSVNTGLKKFQKNFKVQLQSNKVEKISKNFQSPVQINWVWKNSKKFSKFNSSKTWVKKVLSFKCLVEKCQKCFENILSPNQRWLNQEKFQSFKLKNHWVKKSKNKFKVQTGWDIFKLFQNIFSSTLKSMGFQCIHMVFEKEKGWEPSFPSQKKITKAQKCFNSNSTKFYILVQVQINSRWLTYDMWHMKTCDFLWKYRMIWSSYERIG